jgi:glycosyltransferase involved in cell wall biosynthesis
MTAGKDLPDDEAVEDRMYLVLPVPFREVDGQVFVEAQAGNGLDQWAENFSAVLVAAPVIPEAEAQGLTGFRWRPIDSLKNRSRIEWQALPYAYSPIKFFKSLKPTRRLMAQSIARSKHLQFAIGGLFGDWAVVAALEATRQGRKYAIHTDRVEHEVLKRTAVSMSGVRRVRAAIEAPLMAWYHRHVIRRCSLGLWHGDDCYRVYSPWCKENHLIHDVHTKEADLIDEVTLEEKIQRVREAKVFELCYAGRLDPMKAPLEWVRSIAVARGKGVRLCATWYGEGSLLDAAKAEAARLDLGDSVQFPGFVADRASLLECLRSAHAMVFTHVTPESPRILLESLVSGTPILGYDNAYAVDLLSERGGGALVTIHDAEALGSLIAEFWEDRPRLAQLIRQAADNGTRFTDSAVFSERSKLVQQFA